MRISNYLLFDGQCQAAMRFYQEVFGGELRLGTVGDSPLRAMFPAAMHARVLNARLHGPSLELSASDWLQPAERPVQGNTVCLYVSGGSRDETRKLFERLSAGAEVTDPLSDQPFGLYGALNDRFGMRWMFHADGRA